MRAAIALCCLASACHYFDPIAEVPRGHREVATTADAIRLILDENPQPRVYAIGEYHETRNAIAATSPLARFTQEIIGLLEPHAQHLVVEAWLDASCWARSATHDQMTQAIQRPPSTSMEVMNLMSRRSLKGLQSHTLPMTCIEYDAMLDASGHLDFLLLLQMVTVKLAEVTRTLLDESRGVIVYGGALHNDLYPRWPLEELSYARALSRELGGSILEIDLVVPEVVAPMAMIRNEPWFPLLARASPTRVSVWQRGPASYVVILPAQSEEVGRVARFVQRM